MESLVYEHYKKSAEEVERIIRLPFEADFKSELEISSLGVVDSLIKQYYIHMNTLFLNIILNRVYVLGEEARDKAFICRYKIVEILKEKGVI
jgi:hypothetical protein